MSYLLKGVRCRARQCNFFLIFFEQCHFVQVSETLIFFAEFEVDLVQNVICLIRWCLETEYTCEGGGASESIINEPTAAVAACVGFIAPFSFSFNTRIRTICMYLNFWILLLRVRIFCSLSLFYRWVRKRRLLFPCVIKNFFVYKKLK